MNIIYTSKWKIKHDGNQKPLKATILFKGFFDTVMNECIVPNFKKFTTDDEFLLRKEWNQNEMLNTHKNEI